MKSLFKRLVSCVLVLLSVCVFSACGENHTHSYSWYLAKSASCTKDGILEGVCECGNKVFEELKSTGHNFINGICDNCGQNESNILQKVEPGQTIGLNIKNVYETAKTFGYEYTYEEFLNNLSICNNSLENIKIDFLGVLHCVLVANGTSADIILPSMKVDFQLKDVDNLKYVLQLRIEVGGFLDCVLVDGTIISLGKMSDSTTNQTGKILRSIFINNDNVLAVVYSDDTVKAVAKIADTSTAINGAQLCYKKIDGKQEYAVTQLLTNNETKIEIPTTHLGLPVTKIEKKAFYENDNIVEVILSENIKVIDEKDFYGCCNLTTIKLNKGLQEIGKHCFADCTKLQKPVIPASVTICGEYAFVHTSCSIYVDITQKPSSWASNWCDTANKVYWKGQWNYINDTPVPLQ